MMTRPLSSADHTVVIEVEPSFLMAEANGQNSATLVESSGTYQIQRPNKSIAAVEFVSETAVT